MKITLCGSTRFKDAFETANRLLTQAGHIVYSVAFYGHQNPEQISISTHEKMILDLVHLRKILESDAIMIVGRNDGDKHPYIGESTRRELEWARILGRVILVDDSITMSQLICSGAPVNFGLSNYELGLAK